MIPFDTETCGFHGPAVLLQYAESMEDQNVVLHEIFFEPIIETLMLIERIATHPEGVCGFNLAYDWFHLIRTYTILRELAKRVGDEAHPIDHIEAMAVCEPLGRDGPCLKPATALDLMLEIRKGRYQSTMDRKEIRIRRIPRELAFPLVHELQTRIPLNDIYFARAKTYTGEQWKIFEIKDVRTGTTDPEFVDLVLKFAPSSALKAVVIDAGLRDQTRALFKDVSKDLVKPIEAGWAPFALALSSPEKYWYAKLGRGKEGYCWPMLVKDHAYHWRYDDEARNYARDDVIDLQLLWKHIDCPSPGDNDSVLACAVGAVRWRGYAVDLDKIKDLQHEERKKSRQAPKAPAQVYKWLCEVMTPDEVRTGLVDRQGKASTKRTILERVSEWKKDCSCFTLSDALEVTEERIGDDVVYRRKRVRIADQNCTLCSGTGKLPHPAAERATLILEARKAATKEVLYDKLIQAGRLHPPASVIGSLSGRMSGRTEVADGRRASNINSLGIQHDKKIRSAFPLAFGQLKLNGGDFDAYEVAIADAAYNDPELRKQLCTCAVCGHVCTVEEYRNTIDCTSCGSRDSRRKIHGLFAMELYPGMSYDDIIATKGSADDKYDKGKRGIFSQFYGGDENTLVERIGIAIEEARRASASFKKRYAGVGANYTRIFNSHCSMRQPGGIGTKVIWHDPADYIESLNGFRRDFTLENRICRELFQLANDPPSSWLKIKKKVVRRDRPQALGRAVMSALYAGAFQIQAMCMRAALNHVIQSTGAIETKRLQRRLWDVQPEGVAPWHVQPMNIHDEIMCPSLPELQPKLDTIVHQFLDETSKLIPLVKMTWHSNMKSWAEK